MASLVEVTAMNIQSLIQVPENSRDESWEDRFLQALSSSNIALLSEDPQQGPDGWPYLLAETSDQATEPAQKIMLWLAERGIGLAINPQKDYPDFVLTYGMLWSFKETGRFILRNKKIDTGNIEITPQNIKNAGTATEEYLPLYVRRILKDFFRDQGVLDPRILVLTLNGTDYELAFSAESLGNPPHSEWSGIAEAISWFLPTHYSIIIVSEKELPKFSSL